MDHQAFWGPSRPVPFRSFAASAPEGFQKLYPGAPHKGCEGRSTTPGSDDLSFFENRKYLRSGKHPRGVFVAPNLAAERVPEGHGLLISKDPYRSFANRLELFFPDAGNPKAGAGALSRRGSPSTQARRSRRERSSRRARSSDPKRKSAAAPDRRRRGDWVPRAIGRDCFVGPGASITHALIGNRVIIHAGVAHRPGRLRLRHGARRPL